MEEVLSNDELIRLADYFAQLMNQMQTSEQEDLQDVVTAGLYALGCALAQGGAHIDINASIAEALPPLASGYLEAMQGVRMKMT